MSADAAMKFIGELPNGHKVYWANDRFEQPGIHVWNGSTHDHYAIKPTPTAPVDDTPLESGLVDALRRMADTGEHGEKALDGKSCRRLAREALAALTTAPTAHLLSNQGVRDVLTERADQIDKHGFTLEHDLHHHPADLAAGAASYLNTAIDQLHGKDHPRDEVDPGWPWEAEAWRPGDARANLVKALAIGLAVLDRIDGAPRDSGEEPPITEADLTH